MRRMARRPASRNLQVANRWPHSPGVVRDEQRCSHRGPARNAEVACSGARETDAAAAGASQGSEAGCRIGNPAAMEPAASRRQHVTSIGEGLPAPEALISVLAFIAFEPAATLPMTDRATRARGFHPSVRQRGSRWHRAVSPGARANLQPGIPHDRAWVWQPLHWH